MWVYSLTKVQIGYLVSLSEQRLNTSPHNIEIENIGITDKGDIIVAYQQYGSSHCKRISREDTFESIAEKTLFPNLREAEYDWFKNVASSMASTEYKP